MSRIHYTHCPVCHSSDWSIDLQVKDYTVSAEQFPVATCAQCSLRFTQDIPDQAEIGRYYKSDNYISHSNTSKGIINRLYHTVRKRTILRKRKLVEKATGLQTGTVLDIGSGTGSFIQEMKQSGWNTTGLEPDADARKIALDQYNLTLGNMDEFTQLPAQSFDAITLWHVLEHVHALPEYIKRLKELLKENGRIIIAVPNYTSLDAKIYREYWAAYDVPRHLYHFSPRSMEVLLQQHGLRILQHKPLWYDSFYISLLSSKYKNGKTNWLAAGWNGLRSNLAAMGKVTNCSSVIYIIGR